MGTRLRDTLVLINAIFFVTLLLYADVWAAPASEPQGLKFTCIPDKPSGAILAVHDEFGPTDGPRFKTELESCLVKHRAITRIEFTSDGGNVEAAFEIAQTIADYRFHTHVPAGSRCISACTLAFLGGIRRTIHPNGSYEVHGFTGFSSGGEAGFACNLLKTVRKLPQLSQEKVRKVYSEDSENAEALAKEVPHLNSQLLELQSRIAQLNQNAEALLCNFLGVYIQGRLQEIERDSALLSRRWMQMVQQRRVSSKLLDHIFATTTSGVRPLTRQELEELAVITDDGN